MKRLVKRTAPPLVIHAANASLLAILLVGAPLITGIPLGNLRLSSQDSLEQVVLGGLLLGITANLIAFVLCRTPKHRRKSRNWVMLYLLLFAVAYAAHLHWLSFDWLKDLLLQLKQA